MIHVTGHNGNKSRTEVCLLNLILRSRSFQILWLFLFAVALFFYYQWQPPLYFAASRLVPLLLGLGHLFAITGLGWPLAHLLMRRTRKMVAEDVRTPPGSVEFFVALAFGMGMTGIWSFSLGLLGNFAPLLFILWESAGIVLFLVACREWRAARIPTIAWTAWEALGLAILLLFLIALIPFVVAPEISTDAIAYHLLIPKMYLLRGKVDHLALFVEAYYPSLAEYNYLPLLRLSNEIVCKSFHFWIGIVLLIFLSRFIQAVRPGSGRLLAPALFLSMPVTAIHIGWAWNDFMYTFFILLSLYFLFSYHQSAKTSGRDLLLAGILAGLASWTKYTFVLYFLTTLILFFTGYWRWGWRARQFYLFLVGIAIVAPFWLVQNWMFTGNPFYPFLNQIFQSPYWTENSDQFFHDALRHWEIAEWNWLTYLTFPIHVTMKARLVDIQTGILPLILLPLLFVRGSTKGIGFLKAYIAACIFVWLFIHTENRSMFSVFAVIFCVSAVALEEIRWEKSKTKNIILAGILIVSCTNFFYTTLTIYHLFDPFGYFLGRENATQYRSRLSESQKAFDYLNKTPGVGRVMLVSSHVPYYLDRPFVFSSFADPPVAEVLFHQAKDSEYVSQKLRKLGVTHILLNRSAYQSEHEGKLYSWSAQQRMVFEEFLLKRCEPLMRSGQDYVFRVR
jgi:hypothetical protein